MVSQKILVEKARRKEPYIMPKYHFHEEYEIYYLIQGERHYFIKDKTYHIKMGDLVFIDRNVLHKTADVKEPGHERFLLNMSKDFLDFLPPAVASELFRFFKSETCIITLESDMRSKIETLLDEMHNVYRSPGNLSQIYLQTLVIQLLYFMNRLAEHHVGRSKEYINVAHRRVSDVIDFINRHYKEPLSLTDLSHQFFLSPFYLSRLFKKATGFSLTEYINSIRVKEAQELLKVNQKRIIDIALEVGYDNITHFGRVFKQITNQSPRDYRREFLKRKGEIKS